MVFAVVGANREIFRKLMLSRNNSRWSAVVIEQAEHCLRLGRQAQARSGSESVSLSSLRPSLDKVDLRAG